MRAIMVAALIETGCGRFAFDDAPSRDAASDLDTQDMPGDAARSCWSAWGPDVALTVAERVAELSTASEDKNPSLTDDMLTIYFESNRAGGLGGTDVWRATRGSVAAPFVVEGPVNELSSPADDGRVTIDASGLIAVFTSTRPGGAGGWDLWEARRTTLDAPWVVDIAPFATFNTAEDQKDAHFVFGTSRLYYNVGETSFRVTERTTTAYLAPQTVGMAFPVIADAVVSPDEKTVVFTAGGANGELYVSTRASTAEPFGLPTLLTVLSTVQDEQDLYVSPDGCEVWFGRRGPDLDIWRATVILP